MMEDIEIKVYLCRDETVYFFHLNFYCNKKYMEIRISESDRKRSCSIRKYRIRVNDIDDS